MGFRLGIESDAGRSAPRWGFRAWWMIVAPGLCALGYDSAARWAWDAAELDARPAATYEPARLRQRSAPPGCSPGAMTDVPRAYPKTALGAGLRPRRSGGIRGRGRRPGRKNHRGPTRNQRLVLREHGGHDGRGLRISVG